MNTRLSSMTPAEQQVYLANILAQIATPAFRNVRPIILAIIKYVEVRVMNQGYFSSTDPTRAETCSDLLEKINLPEILYLQFVINELKKINNGYSALRDGILPRAEEIKNILLTPYVNQIRAIFLAGLLISVITGLNRSSVAGGLIVGLLSSSTLAQLRLENALAVHLSRERLGDNHVLHLNDGIDDSINRVAAIAGSAIQSGIRLFGQTTQRLDRLTQGRQDPRIEIIEEVPAAPRPA